MTPSGRQSSPKPERAADEKVKLGPELMRLGLPLTVACLLVAGVGHARRARAARTLRPPAAVHRIAVELRGPLALVQVTRSLPPAESPSPDRADDAGRLEDALDLALPERAALLQIEIGQGGRWRPIPTVPAARARDGYREAVAARGLAPAVTPAGGQPFGDDTSYRVTIAHGGGAADGGGANAAAPASAPILVRYRFSTLVDCRQGRQRIRFPASPELSPPPAEVSVTATGLAELEIAGARAVLPAPTAHAPMAGDGARVTATGRASGRAGWEISYRLAAAPVAEDGPSLQASAAVAALSERESAVAFSVQANPRGPLPRPESILFLIDRSRSVGAAGLSAEHEVATRILELYPPSTRFDVLFFDRAVSRLFPMSRPATGEAMAALDGEMVPDRLNNGTDLEGALRAAGALLRREAGAFAPRALLAVITDGAIPEAQTGPRLDAALGALPGLDLSVALLSVRAGDDESVDPAARQALRAVAEARGGVERALRAGEINESVAALLGALAGGGDVFSPRIAANGAAARLAEALGPGEGVSGVVRVAGRLPRAGELIGATRGHATRAPLRLVKVDASWLRPHALGAAGAAPEDRLLSAPGLVALLEPVSHAAGPAAPAVVRGAVDRGVVRNTLSLAFMPRARACYQGRSGATAAARDLTGRVRMAIDLVRGEVVGAQVESSTLHDPRIEDCLRESAFALDVPRAYRNDQPVTAIVNMVFRPRTPEKKHTTEESFPIGGEIDLILEELHKSEQPGTAAPPVD
jgi:hypothetical protein